MAALRVPSRCFYGESMSSMILSMLSDAPRRNAVLDAEGWEGRRVLGYKLPSWQRQEKWTEAQASRFVFGAYRGSVLGSYMWNENADDALSNILIDGQQRLRALELYWSDRVAVEGEDGRLWLWSDLEDAEKARLLRITFPFVLSRYGTEAEMRAAYNEHNYGGTPHLESERAPDPADPRASTPYLPR